MFSSGTYEENVMEMPDDVHDDHFDHLPEYTSPDNAIYDVSRDVEIERDISVDAMIALFLANLPYITRDTIIDNDKCEITKVTSSAELILGRVFDIEYINLLHPSAHVDANGETISAAGYTVTNLINKFIEVEEGGVFKMHVVKNTMSSDNEIGEITLQACYSGVTVLCTMRHHDFHTPNASMNVRLSVVSDTKSMLNSLISRVSGLFNVFMIDLITIRGGDVVNGRILNGIAA